MASQLLVRGFPRIVRFQILHFQTVVFVSIQSITHFCTEELFSVSTFSSNFHLASSTSQEKISYHKLLYFEQGLDSSKEVDTYSSYTVTFLVSYTQYYTPESRILQNALLHYSFKQPTTSSIFGKVFVVCLYLVEVPLVS